MPIRNDYPVSPFNNIWTDTTLKAIAQNANLDPIFTKHEPILDEKLAACNAALKKVTDAVRSRLPGKLLAKQREQGKRAITDADERR